MIIIPRHNGETYFKSLSKNIIKLIKQGDKDEFIQSKTMDKR